MNIIKRFHGIDKAGTTKLFLVLLISSCAGLSCKKETVELDVFSVTLKNNYFEKLDTVKLADKTFLNLPVSTSTPPFALSKGVYSLHCVTHSKLSIDASLNIKGSHEKAEI